MGETVLTPRKGRLIFPCLQVTCTAPRHAVTRNTFARFPSAAIPSSPTCACSINSLRLTSTSASVAVLLFCLGCSWEAWCCGDSGSTTVQFTENVSAAVAHRHWAPLPRPTLPKEKSVLDLCSFTQAQPSETKRNFNVVLLSTYPRSGNSWLRLLLHGATQYMDRGLSTSSVRSGLNKLIKLNKLSICDPEECDIDDTVLFIHRTLKFVPDPAHKEQANKVKTGGINVPTQKEGMDCTHTMTLHGTEGWRDKVNSVSVKTHYPAVTPNAQVEGFTRGVSHVVHTVRNPFDNIASRFLGSKRRFQERFDELVEARKRNTTTEEFSEFLDAELVLYAKFHEYWLERRTTDAKKGIPTLYTRYESMCHNTKDVVAAIAQFGGWEIQWESFTCELEMAPCTAASEGFPQHISLYTPEQIKLVFERTGHLIETFGYEFDPATQKVALETPQIPMCNSA